ncbi:hypothetical protein [Streptomyces sp. NPDC001594]|uniref:hypothetical protein n=1 Tax=Streptomyces sp. NPDC001594 TaxID=3364590 RepID=UPI0036C15958
MRRNSIAVHGVLATVLGVTLTACGGGEGGSTAVPAPSGAKTAGGQAGPSQSPSPNATWGPALALGQPAPNLIEGTDGGTFQVTVQKIVKGGPKQMKAGYYDQHPELGDTPYYVFATYTLKEGKPDHPNANLNLPIHILDENGNEAAQKPVIVSGFEEGGCPVGEVYLGWDIGETRTQCSVWIGSTAKPPARLVWNGKDARTPAEFMKLDSWKWSTQ